MKHETKITSAKYWRGVWAFLAVVLGLPFSMTAEEWFVDPANGSDSDGTGRESAPYLSIQKAVDEASEDDVIVLCPGEHKAGRNTLVYESRTFFSRVNVTKRLVFRSKSGRSGRDETKIVGEWDITPGNYPYGMGPNAVSCVQVRKDASGTRFEGITFCDGAAPYLDGGNSVATRGGGANVWGEESRAYFVDCAFRRCQALRGGAVFVGNKRSSMAARCLFKDCRASKFGSATHGVNCFACVFDGNYVTRNEDGTPNGQSDGGTVGVIASCDMAVNCTIVNNYNRIGYSVGKIRNCTFMHGHYSSWASSVANICNLVSDVDPENMVGSGKLDVCENSHVVSFAESPEVYSPFDEDYRLVRNAVSIGAGAGSHITAFAEMFPEESGATAKDYYGNVYPAADGSVNCGASQAAVEFASSCLALELVSGNGDEGAYEVNGRSGLDRYDFAGLPGWPSAFHVKFVPRSGRGLVRYSVNGNICWAKEDGSIWIAPPGPERVSVVKPILTSNMAYVDAAKGNDDSGDGSAAAPYETIQKAIDTTDKEQDRIIYVREGDYTNGARTVKGLPSRVVLPGNYGCNMLIKAVDGADRTFIGGNGDSAADPVRCLALANDSYAICVQGFTIRNGRTSFSGTGSDTYGAAISALKGAYIVDCAISNCIASRGMVYGGHLERCKIVDCSASGRGILRGSSSEAVSCLFVNCTLSSGNGILSDGAKAYNSTFSGCLSVVRNNEGKEKGYVYNCVVDGKIASPVVDADQAYGTIYQASDKPQVNIADTAKKENPVRFSSDGSFALSLDSQGYRMADVAHLKSAMDFNGNPFMFSTDGLYTAGAFERDWKGDLEVAIANDSVSVVPSYVHASVAAAGKGIALSGGALSLVWDGLIVGKTYGFGAKTVSGGRLVVKVNGKPAGEYGPEFDGDVRFVADSGFAALSVSYEPSADGGGVLLNCFGRRAGFCVSVR